MPKYKHLIPTVAVVALLIAVARADDKKPEAAKPDAKPSSNAQAAKPDAKPEPTGKSEAKEARKDIRVIDLSKPKTEPKPEDKPGEAIRF